MLDDDNSTPTTEATTSQTRTRRRAAGRPAGPPPAVSTDIFAAPEAPPRSSAPRAKAAASADDAEAPKVTTSSRSRSTRKAAAPKKAAEAATDTAAPEGDAPVEKAAGEKAPAKKTAAKKTAAKKTTAKKAPARKKADAEDAPPAVSVAFQPPETVEPARPADDAADERDDAPRSDAEGGSDDGGEGGAPKRRRRSRGGRRRNKSDDAKDEGTDESASEGDESTEDGDGNGSGTTRRRRRRARAGENASSSPDDPENTVVKVREGRNPEDEIAGVTGSTRLEAKKQRRREGREAGRRRAPIVSEAEFLARREAVEREMVVRQHTGSDSADRYTQIAVLEDSVLVEHYVARESQTSLIGNVYLGKVQNVLPSMEAAFVDIGAGRNAVIYAGEVDWSGVGNGKARKIEEALSPGQQILVQVTKDPVGQKGARLTSQISLPGRFLVYVPGGQSNGISRKLPDTERARLKALLKEVLPEDAGVIVRTAAEGATEDQLTRDVTALTARWEDIRSKAGLAEGSNQAKAPQLLYAEPDLVIKVVRDLFNEDFASLVVEGSDAWDNISGYISHVAPDLAERLREWAPDEHQGREAFDVLRIDEQIHKALDRKVWLPSGGSLVIDRTEAMTVVDVNTGKFTGSGGNLEETVTKNNLEAAEEIVRQLRLRDIGGIIVIDFIDMVLESNRELVLRRLVECLGRDRTRHQVAEVTSLGLVQMTRKRIGTGLLESFSTDCDHCKGRGVVITAEPVEPKKDEPRRGGRRGRGGNGNGGESKGNGNGGESKGNGNGGESKGNGHESDATSSKQDDGDGPSEGGSRSRRGRRGSGSSRNGGAKDEAVQADAEQQPDAPATADAPLTGDAATVDVPAETEAPGDAATEASGDAATEAPAEPSAPAEPEEPQAPAETAETPEEVPGEAVETSPEVPEPIDGPTAESSDAPADDQPVLTEPGEHP